MHIHTRQNWSLIYKHIKVVKVLGAGIIKSSKQLLVPSLYADQHHNPDDIFSNALFFVIVSFVTRLFAHGQFAQIGPPKVRVA